MICLKMGKSPNTLGWRMFSLTSKRLCSFCAWARKISSTSFKEVWRLKGSRAGARSWVGRDTSRTSSTNCSNCREEESIFLKEVSRSGILSSLSLRAKTRAQRPMMPFRGVRMSWETEAKKAFLELSERRALSSASRSRLCSVSSCSFSSSTSLKESTLSSRSRDSSKRMRTLYHRCVPSAVSKR